MKIIITENQKKKLFTPKGLNNDSENRYIILNKTQPVKNINGEDIRINQYDIDGNKIGYWEEYWDNGKLWFKGNFINGKREGYWEYYHPNGQLYCKGHYLNGGIDGYWEYYYNNGQLMIDRNKK